MTGNYVNYKGNVIEEHCVNGQLYYTVRSLVFDTFEQAKEHIDFSEEITQELEGEKNLVSMSVETDGEEW